MKNDSYKNVFVSRAVAKALLDIKAVGFVPDAPIRFKSGILSPVYLDNRRFPFYPKQWHTIIESFIKLIAEKNIEFDVIAGVEAAGIPHSAGLAFAMNKPSVFVRKQAKDHGTKKMVEGGDVAGKTVLLVEDHVSTGLSSLAAIESLREAGAKVEICFAISEYGFTVAAEEFSKHKARLLSLVDFPTIVDVGIENGKIKPDQKQVMLDWMNDPKGWEQKYQR
ncbi:MAG: orotate phosphoribosyltransferase [Candidatus Pacebacteria bacterium CG10_big_fil_rev_8_21_14_0_10_36_11]|nr:orotate phosphoribosyltransferase [Candidatus Pacearchaeota archaeon]OIP73722.1 MAG: orotate phosphoribosyltransferase [Candidatus Pacebacteria bacterium CG2_30_36_39]PIR64692.1 MAG: orotate phosphoribosyltransferase [Candidatus Pacebacteria bacterium CG10_big_fil_rev_8_21_14_0_10_36_11]PJC43089.1 MAG: orotate phosphoribosyltransferase [Candidatus Pacebacteria bacterium CG_4_9_14_0_2_um_filter_36_8]